MRALLVHSTMIFTVQCAFGNNRDRNLASSGIRRLRRTSPRSTAGPLLTSAKPENSCMLFIGILPGSQVSLMAAHL